MPATFDPTTATAPELAELIAARVAEGHSPEPAVLTRYRELTAPEPKRVGRRPLRNFRYDEDAWQDVILLGELTDRNASDVVRDALAAYVPAQLEPLRPADA